MSAGTDDTDPVVEALEAFAADLQVTTGGGGTHLRDGTRLSGHAATKWDDRTPADSVAPETAYYRGEDVQDPAVVAFDDGADRVRVYHDPDGWVAVFLVHETRVVTVILCEMIGHLPTRRYLRAHGPHGGDES
jgi:hypothetical protein